MKQYLDVRLSNVPPANEVMVESVRKLRNSHVSKYVTIFGTAVRTSNVKNRELQRDFQCKKCGKVYTAQSDIFEYSRFNLPPVCGGEIERKKNPFMNMVQKIMHRRRKGDENGDPMHHDSGSMTMACNGTKFIGVNGTSLFSDY